MSKKPKIALAMIVAARDSEAKPLRRCLKYAAPHVDGIFITVTGKNKKVEKVAKDFDAEVSHFKWVDHFAKARNFNFDQVPKEYTHILWLDADDALRGGEKLRPTIEENPDVDVFSFWYLYAFDEYKNPVVVHHKTRVIKNDGCVEWVGALHEDFKENRNLERKHVDGIEVLHLTDDERIESARVRNLVVASADAEENPDDPRSYWNLGNSLKAAGQDKKAIEAFDTFLEKSKSDDEKYIARLRRAEAFWSMGEEQRAIDEVQYAIGLKPRYPDAYYMAGSLFYNSERFTDAAEMFLHGLQLPKPYHKIIVYNPRDYDFNPMMNLAKCYFQLSRPDLALPLLEGCADIQPENEGLKKTIKLMKEEVDKLDKVLKALQEMDELDDKEKLKEFIDNLEEDVASHPAICRIRNQNFVKEESSGKDLVYFCGLTQHEWDPDVAKEKGVGGSEEAVIHLAKRWSDAGWNVTVYNNCGHKEKTFDGVTYKPFWMWNPADKQDVTILWRHPRYLKYDINSDQVFVDLHDVVMKGEFTEERLMQADKIFVKTEFHRSLYPNIPDEKVVVIPNGIDASVFEGENERDPMLVINTSSPDRSLSSYIKVAEMVREEIPEADFRWAYGWGVFDSVHGNDREMMEWRKEMEAEMERVGITNLGRVNHEEVAELYNAANVFLYPTEFAEIHCISAVKAQAGGAIPVSTDFAALAETIQFGEIFSATETAQSWSPPGKYDFAHTEDLEEMAEKTIELLKNPRSEEEREEMRAWARETYEWDSIAKQWALHM